MALPLGPLRASGTLSSGRPNRQARRWHDEVVTERAVLSRGFTKGEALPPPLELNYITFSPSRTVKVRTIAFVPLREGVSERRWRSAANRPSRQARPGGGLRYTPPTRQARRWHDEVVTERAVLSRGFTKGEALPPPLELNYIIVSPSRTARVRIIAFVPLREGAGGGYRKTVGYPPLKSRRTKCRGIFMACGANRPGAGSERHFLGDVGL